MNLLAQDPLSYPGIPETTLESRWSAAITLVEMVLRHYGLEELPLDNSRLLDKVLDDIDVLFDMFALHFVTDLIGEEEVDALAG